MRLERRPARGFPDTVAALQARVSGDTGRHCVVSGILTSTMSEESATRDPGELAGAMFDAARRHDLDAFIGLLAHLVATATSTGSADGF